MLTTRTVVRPISRNLGQLYRNIYHKVALNREKFIYNTTEFRVFEDRELIYIPISKAACTSISLAIAPSYDIEIGNLPPILIHSNKHWNVYYKNLPSKYSAFYKFSFVRNPFARLVSCYREKVLWNEPTIVYPRPYFVMSAYPFDIKTNMSFADFVDVVCDIPDQWADRHFKTQASTLTGANYSIDFIGKQEDIESDWQVIADKYGFENTLAKANSTTKTSANKQGFQTYYTRELAQKVAKYYAQDIELFDYQDAYAELL